MIIKKNAQRFQPKKDENSTPRCGLKPFIPKGKNRLFNNYRDYTTYTTINSFNQSFGLSFIARARKTDKTNFERTPKGGIKL